MSTPIAVLKSGDENILMADYTPGSAVTAGDVVVQSSLIGVAVKDIAASAKGALAIDGGVWTMPKDTTSSAALSAGELVYWDATNEVVTTTASANIKFGFVTLAAAAAAATVEVAKSLLD